MLTHSHIFVPNLFRFTYLNTVMYIIITKSQFRSQHQIHHICIYSKNLQSFIASTITIQYLFMRKKFSKLNTYSSKNVKFKTLNSTHIQIYIFFLAHYKTGLTEPRNVCFCGLCRMLLSRNMGHSS
jgi:hypothetical protein